MIKVRTAAALLVSCVIFSLSKSNTHLTPAGLLYLPLRCPILPLLRHEALSNTFPQCPLRHQSTHPFRHLDMHHMHHQYLPPPNLPLTIQHPSHHPPPHGLPPHWPPSLPQSHPPNRHPLPRPPLRIRHRRRKLAFMDPSRRPHNPLDRPPHLPQPRRWPRNRRTPLPLRISSALPPIARLPTHHIPPPAPRLRTRAYPPHLRVPHNESLCPAPARRDSIRRSADVHDFVWIVCHVPLPPDWESAGCDYMPHVLQLDGPSEVLGTSGGGRCRVGYGAR